MNIELPESMKAYYGDPAVKLAVDTILSNKKLAIPSDMRWEEFPAFYGATLAAHQVQVEFALFMFELWNIVWNPVLKSSDIWNKLSFLNLTGKDSYSHHGIIWKNRFVLPELESNVRDSQWHLWTGIEICHPNPSCLQLRIYLGDEEFSHVSELAQELDDYWDIGVDDDDAEYAFTHKQIGIIENGVIDLDEVCRIAKGAVESVGRYIGFAE